MGLSRETVGSDLLKSDSVKSRLWWLKNKVWPRMRPRVLLRKITREDSDVP